MKEKHKKLSNKRFEFYIDLISKRLQTFLKKNNLNIDYICPIMRSGAVPAVYIANQLNIIKFAPFQHKHITYKNGETGYVKLFMPFASLSITKKEPVFLMVDGLCASGATPKACIEEFKNHYPDAKFIYVCIAKQYGTDLYKELVIYDDQGYFYNGNNKFTKQKCLELGVEYNVPLFPWEILEQERNHPDDLEENIFF